MILAEEPRGLIRFDAPTAEGTYSAEAQRLVRSLSGPVEVHLHSSAPARMSNRDYRHLFDISTTIQRLAVDGLRRRAGTSLAAAVELTRSAESTLAPVMRGRPRWIERSMFCRPDVLVAGSAFQVIELNFGSILSGQAHQPLLSSLLLAGVDDPRRFRTENYFEARLAYLREQGYIRDGGLLLLASGVDRERGFGVFLDAELRYLRGVGVRADSAAPEHVEVGSDGQFHANGRTHACAVRLFNSETYLERGGDPGVLDQLNRSDAYVSPEEAAILSSNMLLCWLHEDAAELGPERRSVVGAVPWTAHLTASARAGDCWLAEEAEANKDQYLLKPLNAHSGRGVLLGRETDASRWRQGLDDACRTELFCLQRCVTTSSTTFPVTDGAGRQTTETGTVVVGPFTAGRRPGGVLIRLHPSAEASGVINWDGGTLLGIGVVDEHICEMEDGSE